MLLFADNEEFLVELIALALEARGIKTITAFDGKKAWDLLQENASSVKALLTDIEMPAMNGWELIEKVYEAYPKLPVIILSAMPDIVSDAKKWVDLGSVKAVISKSEVAPAEFVSQVLGILGERPE